MKRCDSLEAYGSSSQGTDNNWIVATCHTSKITNRSLSLMRLDPDVVISNTTIRHSLCHQPNYHASRMIVREHKFAHTAWLATNLIIAITATSSWSEELCTGSNVFNPARKPTTTLNLERVVFTTMWTPGVEFSISQRLTLPKPPTSQLTS